MGRTTLWMVLLLGLALAVGCSDDDDDDDTTAPGDDDSGSSDDDDDATPQDDDDSSEPVDLDGDGHSEPDDCNDNNADVHPGAEHVCDGVLDNDCDGILDGNEIDDDGDGYTECDGDCDDEGVQPHATWPGWSDVTVEEADASLVGEFYLDWAGSLLAVPGDLNGDGIDDVTIGARENDEGGEAAGKVYLLLGRASGWSLDEPLAGLPSFVGDADNMEMEDVAWVGDASGDGIDDLLLMGSRASGDGLCHSYLIHGGNPGWVPSMSIADADVWTTDPTREQHLSCTRALEYVGDVNEDGTNDWIQLGGAIEDSMQISWIISGAGGVGELLLPDDALGWVHGEPGDNAQLVPLGDFDGDGIDDMKVVLQPNGDRDAISVILGQAGSLPSEQPISAVRDHRFTFDPDCYFTSHDELVGDLDGDGFDDFVITASPNGSATCGGLYVFFGRSNWPAELTREDADVHIVPGHEPSMPGKIGDINGDGLDDLAMRSSPTDPEDETDVYIEFGRARPWPSELGLADMDLHIAPAPPLTNILARAGVGSPAATDEHKHTGDLDGDGIDELILYNSSASFDGMESAGIAAVFAGRSCWPREMTTDDADATFRGSIQYQNLAYRDRIVVADVNGDGMDDMLLSSYYHPADTREGQVFVFFGRPRTP